MTRTEAKKHPCVFCGAKPGRKCVGVKRKTGKRAERESCHRERHEEASSARARAHAFSSLSVAYPLNDDVCGATEAST